MKRYDNKSLTTKRWFMPDTLPIYVIAILLALVPPIALVLDDPFLIRLFTRIVIFATAAVSLNFVLGFGGFASLLHAAFMGLNAFPVVHGHIDDSFLTDDVHGSVDGDFFRQDRIVTSAGQLPRLDSTTAIVLDPDLARLFGVGVGGRVTYAFVYYPEGKPVYQFRSYTVAAIDALGNRTSVGFGPQA